VCTICPIGKFKNNSGGCLLIHLPFCPVVMCTFQFVKQEVCHVDHHSSLQFIGNHQMRTLVRFHSHTLFSSSSSPLTLSLSLLSVHTLLLFLLLSLTPFFSHSRSHPVPLSSSVSCSLSLSHTHTAAHRDLAECQACPDPVGETTIAMGSTDISFFVCAYGFERDCKVC